MTQSLNDFISSIRLADSLEQERFLIATEQAQIRAYLRKMDPIYRPRIVSKLVFLDMIGQNPAWGQMEAITLMTNDRYSYKRIGYICTSILLDQTNELTVLVTQTLLKDLTSPDSNIICLALSFISNLGSPEVCRAVASEVQKLLEHPNPSVMKRAGMSTVRILRMNPDLSESYKNSVQSLLNSNNHGVVIAGINLVISMIENEPKLAKAWVQFSGPFTKILKSLMGARPTREFSYGVFNDPYMQIKCMKALSLLRKRSDELDGLLQSIISSTETRRNTGRSILYQAVETIVVVSKKSSLRGLAFNQVGRLLSMRDPNVLYSALSVFARVLYQERAIINRGSVDSMALQRYKNQITKCLNHKDPSIRRRALDVISALIDESNAEQLIPEILSYMRLADSEFRSELVSKIYSATQRFAPNNEWNFDTVHQIIIDSGNYVSMDIISNFCDLIAHTPELQPHAVKRLTDSLISFNDNQTLMQIAAFVVGEFSTSDNGAIESLRHIIKLPQTIPETKMYIITALAKMSSRFGARQEIIETMKELAKSNNLEVQQRAGEMMKLLCHPEICDEMLLPIETNQQSMASKINIEDSSQQPMAQPNTNTKNRSQPPVDDLLLLVLDDTAPSPQPAQQQSQQSRSLLDELGSVTQPVQQPIQPKVPQSTELLRKGDFVIYGQSSTNPKDPRQTALRLLFYGVGPSPLTDFNCEYQAGPGWQINIKPSDGNVLPPMGGQPITQIVYVFNMNNTPFLLQVRASYKFGSQPLTENGSIRVLPQ